ncbi:MBL fold metallo-hydrolase [Kribbella sp. NBC_00709]|uniref:MBL fold metallo-hydrolase n=1 Tax=Kribbella sp. NBC_00709 TaxID=2975972 RepID=UPI002E2B2C25|nr:MBL fold metallo-hydrolase [Kribbella sp. NBC_00709]
MPAVTQILSGHLLTSSQGNPAFCSVLLVESAGRLALFDTGHAGRRRYLLEGLSAYGVTPGDIEKLVISHGHWDHVQNADLFPSAEVLIHPLELRNLENPPARDLGTPRWARAILADLNVHEVVEDDEILPGVHILDLPGHTPGSIGLLIHTEPGLRVVLAADAVPTLTVLGAGRAGGRPYDRARADAAVARVAACADVVYPGHDRMLRRTAEGGFEYAVDATPLTFRVP